MAARWLGPLIAVAVGAGAGWLWGRSIAQSAANNPGGPVPGLPQALGLLGLGAVVVVLLVVAGLLFLSPRRRRLSAALVAGAIGWIGGYAIALVVGYP